MKKIFAGVVVLLLTGCSEDICQLAAQKYTECTARPVSILPDCNVAAAEFVVASPCWSLGGSGKAEGSVCGSVVGCEATIETQTLTLTANEMKALLDPELIIWVGAPDELSRLPVALIHRPNNPIPSGSLATPDAFTHVLAVYKPTVLLSTTVRSAGNQVAFWYGTAKYALKVEAVAVEREEPEPEEYGLIQASEGNAPPPAVTVMLTIGPAGAELAEDPQLNQLSDVILETATKTRFPLSDGWWEISLDRPDGTPGVGTALRRCGDAYDPYCILSAKGGGPMAMLNIGRQQPWAGEGSIIEPLQVDVADAAAACPGCVRLTVLGKKDAAVLILTIDAVDKDKDIVTSTGEVTLHGNICNNGATTVTDAGSLTLAFVAAQNNSTVPDIAVALGSVKAGGCHKWEGKGTFEPGDYTANASLPGGKVHQTAFTVPPRSTEPSQPAPTPAPAPAPAPTPKPDLTPILEDPEIDAEAGRVTIKGQICNKGDADADESVTRISFEADGSNNVPADQELGVKALKAGGCHSWNPVNVTVSQGRYTIKVLADSKGKKEREDTKSFEMPARPEKPKTEEKDGVDLQVSTATTQPNGSQVTLQIELCNRGSQPAPSSKVGIFFATDAQPQCSQPPLASINFPALTAGQCASTQTQAFARTPGTIWLMADPNCAITESSDANNFKQLTLTPAPTTSPPGQTGPKSPNSGAAKNTAESSDGCQIGAPGVNIVPVPVVLFCLCLLPMLRRTRRRR